MREVNARRMGRVPGKKFTGESCSAAELAKYPELAAAYITASPRMALYMKYSAAIYNIYLKFAAPEDIHVYSIDEVFIDLTHYLGTHRLSPEDLARRIIGAVFADTGITATAGTGTNLYLCKIAMDIVAKRTEPDRNGVRLAALDEASYRALLWDHRPLTDFWRVGRGYAAKLEANGIFTMGDIARCSLGGPNDYHNEDFLYRLFGVNAELLIDHAWGWECCTMAEIKAYRPQTSSLSSGQVLFSPYSFDKAKLVVREMTEMLVLDLVDKGLVTDQITLTIGYDIENLKDKNILAAYGGEVTSDYYGRRVPKHAHGTANLDRPTSSARLITKAVLDLYDRTVNPALLVRRINLCANRLSDAGSVRGESGFVQLNLFADEDAEQERRAREDEALEREARRQKAVLAIKKKYGKNAILKGTNFEEGATAIARNGQIGGHKA
jgi:DNA polymerase V